MTGQVVDSLGETHFIQTLGEAGGDIVNDGFDQYHMYSWVLQTSLDLPPGPATVTWANVPGFKPPDPPSQTWTVEASLSDDVVHVTYLRPRGPLSVTVSPEFAPWTLYPVRGDYPYYAPGLGWEIWEYSERGDFIGNQFFSSLPAIEGHVFWGELPNYDMPEPRLQAYTAVEGQTVEVTGVYTRHSGSVAVAVTPDTAPWSFTDGTATHSDSRTASGSST